MYIECCTCGALSHLGCNSHCICDEIAPNRTGDGRFAAMFREALKAKGMGFEDVSHLLAGKGVHHV